MKIVFSILIAFSIVAKAYSQTRFYEKGKYGVKDASGNVILKATYDYIGDFENGYAEIKKNENYGLINSQGVITIEPVYNMIHPIKGYDLYDISVVKAGVYSNSRKHGLITPGGKILLEPIHYNQVDFDPIYHVSKIVNNHGEGLINAAGRIVIPVAYSDIKLMGNRVQVQSRAGFGLFDLEGNMLIPLEYTRLIKFNEGLWGALKKEHIEYFNNEGKKTSPHIYERGHYFMEGYAAVKRNGKYGFINSTGKEVIACEYDTVYAFKDGKSQGIKNGKSFHFSVPEKKQISTGENSEPFALISMKDIELIMKNPEFKYLLTAKALFTSGPLQNMEQKATSPDTYEAALKSSQGNTNVKKTLRTENKTKGVHFQYLSNSKTESELFFDETQEFCYYNTLVNEEELQATNKALKEKEFIVQTSRKDNGASTDTWKKVGFPYTIIVRYAPGSKGAQVNFLANSFLKNSKVE
jgi:hypothetical protein